MTVYFEVQVHVWGKMQKQIFCICDVRVYGLDNNFSIKSCMLQDIKDLETSRFIYNEGKVKPQTHSKSMTRLVNKFESTSPKD